MKFITLEKLNLSISYIKDWIQTYIDRFTAKLSPIKLREVQKFPFEVVPDLGEWFASPMTGIEILDHFPTLEDVSQGNAKALHLVFTDKTKFPEYIYLLGNSLDNPNEWDTITVPNSILENTFNYAYFHPRAINMTVGNSIYVVETEDTFDCIIYIPVSGYANFYTPYLVFSHTPDKFDPEAVKFRLNDEGAIDIDRSNIITEYDEIITNKSIYSKFNIFANSDKLYIKNVGNFDGTNQRNADVVSATEILNESKELLDSIPTIIDHPYPFYVVDGLGDWKVNPFGSNTILSSFPNNESSNSGKVLHLIFTDKSRVPKCMYVVYRSSSSPSYSQLSAINLIDYSYTDPTKHNNTDTLWMCRYSTNAYMAECEDCFDALLLLPSGPWDSYGCAMYIIFSETAQLNDINCTAMLLNAQGTIDYVGRPTYIKDTIITQSMLSNITDLGALTNTEKLQLEAYYKLPTIEVWVNRIWSKRKTIYNNELITMEICSTENLKHYPFSFFQYMARTGDYPTITVDVSEEIEYQWLDGESTSPVQDRYMWRTYFNLDATASDVSHTFRPLEFIQLNGITYRIIYKGLDDYNTRESYIYKKAEILDIDSETNKPSNCITYSEIENRLISADTLKGIINEVELNLKQKVSKSDMLEMEATLSQAYNELHEELDDISNMLESYE